MHEKARLSAAAASWRNACKAFLLALGVLLVFALLAPFAWGRDAGSSSVGGTPKAVQIPQAAHQYRLTLTREARRVWGLSAPVSSFAAQIHQESGWNANARSPVGALGLTQFMPATARWMGSVDPVLSGGASLNPTWAIRALVVYDKWLWDRLPSANACEQLAFAMSSYNGGLGWALKRRARSSEPGLCLGKTCAINPGITLANQHENETYPKRILLRIEPAYEAAGWGLGACP